MPKSKKSKKASDKSEILYIFRISQSKLICAKSGEIANYKMRYGSLAENGRYIHV